MRSKIILASASVFRYDLLSKAGINVSRETAQIDERLLEKQNQKDLSPADLVLFLAEAKAAEVSRRFFDSLVIGCDQILVCEGTIYHKVRGKEEARERLSVLSGKIHQLYTAIAIYREKKLIWQYSETASLSVRPLTDEFITTYLLNIDIQTLSTPGIYRIEGRGIQLFDKIIGDYHVIIGLPLLPLLQFLRKTGFIDG